MSRVAIIQIPVADMEAAVAFYRDVLGLMPQVRPGSQGVELAGAGLPLLLVQASVAQGGAAGITLWFQTGDLARTLAEFARQGVDLIHRQPQPCPMGVYAAFRDPSGNAHAMIQFLA
ncbi:MAG: VOC family protein [Anaerolineae bacterium]